MKKSRPSKKFINYFKGHENVLRILQQNGFMAFFIGGCVRDALISRDLLDFDIATNARYQDIERIFEKVINTGGDYGTYTVLHNDKQYQITTFRSDFQYSNNRHPDRVLFSDSLKVDVRRRDFTINSLAYDLNYIYDYQKGLKHLKRRIIKSIGNPEKRFKEDALRMLRAVRFAYVLHFNIDKRTFSSIQKNAKLLSNISKERVYSEIKKIVQCADNLDLLFDSGLAKFIFIHPEKINKDLSAVSNEQYILKLSYVFKDYFNPPEFVSDYDEFLKLSNVKESISKLHEQLQALKLDNKTTNKVKKILILSSYIDMLENKNMLNELSIRTLLTHNSQDVLRSALSLNNKKICTDKIYTNKTYINTTLLLDTVVEKGYIKGIQELAVNGHDLMEIGFLGKDIKKVQKYLLSEVLCDISLNNKGDLINLAKKLSNF